MVVGEVLDRPPLQWTRGDRDADFLKRLLEADYCVTTREVSRAVLCREGDCQRLLVPDRGREPEIVSDSDFSFVRLWHVMAETRLSF